MSTHNICIHGEIKKKHAYLIFSLTRCYEFHSQVIVFLSELVGHSKNSGFKLA